MLGYVGMFPNPGGPKFSGSLLETNGSFYRIARNVFHLRLGGIDDAYFDNTVNELRKKPPTLTFIRGLIWSARAKGKCWFAKDRESKNAPRKSRKMVCICA